MLTERELIARYFSWSGTGSGVVLGIGDDAAILSCTGQQAITCDTLVAGTHFSQNTDPFLLGRKTLAVNLSDLAAMGATPRYALLSLTLSSIDESWLEAYARGFREMAERHQVALVGGDLSHGQQASFSVTALGSCPEQPLLQNGVQVGDDVWLSGSIGGALAQLQANAVSVAGSVLHDPQPRVELGKKLAGKANAAVDLSDGLCAGCLLLASASGVRLELEGDKLPLANEYPRPCSLDVVIEAARGGDDYELLFTADRARRAEMAGMATEDVPVKMVGKVLAGKDAVIYSGTERYEFSDLGDCSYQHFQAQGVSSPPSDAQLFVQARELGEKLATSKKTIATAESCTGGLLAANLSAVPGASAWFDSGFVTYTATAKETNLGVVPASIREYGIVSEEVAREMSVGAMHKSGSSLAIAITGWAGPESGDKKQPVGTVWIASSFTQARVKARKYKFAGTRDDIRRRAVAAAMKFAAQMVSQENGN